MTRDEVAGVILERILTAEGGVANVGDGQGVTRFGQTPRWLATFGFPPPETSDQALANYRTWLVRTRLIAVCDEPDVFAWCVIDWAVQSGHVVAVRALQRALGIHIDGIIGPETEDAVLQCNRRRMAVALIAANVRFEGRLVTDDPKQYARFAAGWANRNAVQIEALATSEETGC